MRSFETTHRFIRTLRIFAVAAALVFAAAQVAAGCTAALPAQAWAGDYSASSAKFSDLSGQTVAATASEAAEKHVHVYDHAGILDSATEQKLSAQISQMITSHGVDIVIFTDTTVNGASSRKLYAADFYEGNGYGIGSEESGMVFFICMQEGNRGWYTAAKGAAKSTVTSDAVNYVDDRIEPYMKKLDFTTATQTYLDTWDGIYAGTINPSKASGGSSETTASDILTMLGISLVIGIIVGIIWLRRKQKKMKTIAVATEAREYMVRNSLHLRDQSDRYVTTTVVRTPKVKMENNKSDFGGFSSSGGGSFSGGGRDF